MFSQIDFGSPQYEASLALRETVLRRPLGRCLTPADTQGEEGQLHFGLFDGEQLTACLVAKPCESTRVILRQMAVADAWRGKGAGKQLIEAVERVLRERGIESLELSARRVAEGFYRKLGYEAVGEPYIDIGIEHIRMTKHF